MKFTLEIDMDNAAFGAGFNGESGTNWNELTRIVQNVIYDMNTGNYDGKSCYDINGNKVGAWEVTE
jgi:hypothetical protein